MTARFAAACAALVLVYMAADRFGLRGWGAVLVITTAFGIGQIYGITGRTK
jgi:hypothetical protein